MEKLFNQFLQFPPDNDRFLEETAHLENADFVREVYNTYLKRLLDAKGVAQLDKILIYVWFYIVELFGNKNLKC